MIRQQRADITDKSRRIRELEDYIDQLIVRILEFNPTILHAPVLRKPAFRYWFYYISYYVSFCFIF